MSEPQTTTQDQNIPEPIPFTRHDHRFSSHGLSCGAWLYLPQGVSRPPVIVMAHGFGGQRWMGLTAYAEYFAGRGLAVFLFDYRCFNDSEGQPRNYVNPSWHLQDWEAAVAYVRMLKEVDEKRVALWGTSFSGGHVIITAARVPGIAAIVSQVPLTDGMAASGNYTVKHRLRALAHGLWDVVKAACTGKRHNVLMTGEPEGPFSMMCTPDAKTGLMRIMGIEDDRDLEPFNFCPADIVLRLPLYNAYKLAGKVTCPALVIGAEKDSLFPPDGPRKAASRMPKSTYISAPMNHFDPYVGEPFDQFVVQMADFYMKILL